MGRRRRSSESAEIAYLRPIVERLGADEVHRLVGLIAIEVADEPEGEPDPSSA